MIIEKIQWRMQYSYQSITDIVIWFLNIFIHSNDFGYNMDNDDGHIDARNNNFWKQNICLLNFKVIVLFFKWWSSRMNSIHEMTNGRNTHLGLDLWMEEIEDCLFVHSFIYCLLCFIRLFAFGICYGPVGIKFHKRRRYGRRTETKWNCE